jgi:hypothetical protein
VLEQLETAEHELMRAMSRRAYEQHGRFATMYLDMTDTDKSQGSWRISLIPIWGTVRQAALSRSMRFLIGFRVTADAGWQLRIPRDHRLGFRCLDLR